MCKIIKFWLFALQVFLFTTSLTSTTRDDDFDRLMGEPQDRTKWVDPLDMGIYEPSEPVIDKKLEESLKSELNKCSAKLKICQTDRNSENNNKTETKHKTKVSENTKLYDLFLKRHVKVLLQKMKISTDEDVHLNLEIKLTAYDISVLRAFAGDGSANVHDVDQILSDYIKAVDQFHLEQWSWHDDFSSVIPELREPLLLAIAAVTLFYVLNALMRCLPWWKLVIFLLILSVSWHWLRLYKMRWAAKHATLLSSGTVPPECHPQEMTWLQSLQYTARSVMSGTDRCGEYHEAIMVDPIYEVNPLTAAVDLATNLLLHPLSKLGSEIGAMFAGLLSAVPLIWKVPVLLVFVILLMLVLVMVAGYRVRLPMFLGAIEPARGSKDNVAIELEAIKLALQEMKAVQKAPAIEMEKAVKKAPAVEMEKDELVGVLETQQSLDIAMQNSSIQNIVLPIKNVPADVVTTGNETPSRKKVYDKVEKVSNFSSDRMVNTPSRKKLYDNQSFESSQPVNLCKTVVAQQLETNSGVLDLSTPSKKSRVPRENSTSESLCVTPTKTLVIKGASSPGCTEFSWETTGDSDTLKVPRNQDDSDDRGEKVGDREFLRSVEDIFEVTKDLIREDL